MYIYILLFFLSIFLLCIDKVTFYKKYIAFKDVFFILSFFSVFIFTVFRYNVGWDYKAYDEAIIGGIDNSLILRGELLTVSLIKFSRTIHSLFFYFFINSFIFYTILYIFLKKYSVDKWVSFFIFLCFPLFFLNSLGVVRIFTAIAIVLYGIDFIIKKKYFKCVLIFFLASLFHKSALIALCFLLFGGLNISAFLWFLILCISPFVASLILPIIEYILPDYSLYLSETDHVEGTRAIYFFSVIAMFMIFYRSKLIDGIYSNLIFYNIYMFGVCIYLAFIDLGTMGHRLSLYGTMLSIVIVPLVFRVINGVEIRFFIKILFFIFLFLIFLMTLNVSKEAYIPYNNIFTK